MLSSTYRSFSKWLKTNVDVLSKFLPGRIELISDKGNRIRAQTFVINVKFYGCFDGLVLEKK